MRSTQLLPENYIESRTIDIKKDWRINVIFNLGALILLVAGGILFFRMIALLRPAEMITVTSQLERGISLSLYTILLLIGLMVAYIVLHEALHGVFFWLYTRSKPEFAFRGYYAYAAAPDWFIPRNQYLVTALAPLVGITIMGLIVIAAAPPALFLYAWFVLTMNISGAVGDILIVLWLLFKPTSSMIRDKGDAVTLYTSG
jgi:hypothetical protein